MAKRVESASSINTFLQCNRRYYYQYVEKLPTKPSIHTVRGNIAHSTLEEFYNLDFTNFTSENYRKQFKLSMQKMFMEQWGKYKTELKGLNLTSQELAFYFEETLFMVLNWCEHFLSEFAVKFDGDIQKTFNLIKPLTEVEYSSEVYGIRGYVDAIKTVGNEVHILDYKTNANSEVKDSIRLQLALYSILYQEKNGKFPDKLGVFFLRDKLIIMDVDLSLIEKAKKIILELHEHTSKTDKVEDYKKIVTGLCKWHSGKCDFYEVCRPHG